MIWELISDKIQFIDSVSDWKAAIRLVATDLLEADSIEPRYIDAMIEMCEQFNGYIVLNELFAMPHASHEYGAKKLDAAILIVSESIDFFDKPVNILLAISPIDKNSHLDLLKDVANYFGNLDFIYELAKTTNFDEFQDVLAKYHGKEVVDTEINS